MLLLQSSMHVASTCVQIQDMPVLCAVCKAMIGQSLFRGGVQETVTSEKICNADVEGISHQNLQQCQDTATTSHHRFCKVTDVHCYTWECFLAVVKLYPLHKHITTTQVLRVKEDKLRCSRRMPKERDTHRGFYGSYILSVMERGHQQVCLLVFWMEGDVFEGCLVCAE